VSDLIDKEYPLSDLFTLLSLRDDVYAAYENAKRHNSMRHQWSGLLATLSMIEQKIQAEMDSREEYAVQEDV